MAIAGCAAAMVALVSTTPAPAQTFTFERVQVHEFDFDLYPTSMALGDIDGDGRDDLVITGRTLENVIAVMRGTSGGTFLPPAFIDVGSQTEWVLLEDFDGDDILDLVIARRTAPGIVSFLHGFGDGSFAGQVDFVVGRNPVTLAAVDLDQDDDLDVAVVNNNSNSVMTLYNDGDGNFTLEQTILVNHGWRLKASPYFSAVADLEMDGDPDLVVAHLSTGYAVLLLNDGSGHLQLPRYAKVGGPAGFAVADVDGDQDPDLLFADLLDLAGKLTVVPNVGDAVFEDRVSFFIGGWTWYTAAGDLDGNGTVDAIITDVFNGQVHLLSNEGGAEPVEFADSQPIGGFSFARHVLVRDLDGDCDLDLLAVDIASHELHVLHNETPQGDECPGGSAAPLPPVAFDRGADPRWREAIDGLRREVKGDASARRDVLIRLSEWGPEDPVGRRDESNGAAAQDEG